MGKWLSNVIDRIFVVLGALVFMQMPLFMHQYQQQLIGHVAELQWQVNWMHKSAMESGKSLDGYITKFAHSADKDIAHQGEMMQIVVKRWHHLSGGLLALQNATVLTRPIVFVYHINYDIMKSTLQTFAVGMPLTLEGVIYALFGMLVGYFFYLLLSRLIWLFFWNSPRKSRV